MDIITSFNNNVFNFNEKSEMICVGFATGPIRMVVSVAQVILNALALIFVSPFVACRGGQDSEWSAIRTFRHLGEGAYEFYQGFLDIIPGTSICRSARCLCYKGRID